MNLRNISNRLRSELVRAFRNKKYDVTDTGIYIPESKLALGGRYGHSVTRDGDRSERIEGSNLIVNEGLTYGIKAMVAGFTQIGSWYIAPFLGNVTPVASLTAGGVTAFSTTQSEYTLYDEGNRVLWDQNAESGQEINNSGNEAAFTISTGTLGTIWGFGLLSVAAKSSTSGTLLSCYKMASARNGLLAGDILNVDFALVAADA